MGQNIHEGVAHLAIMRIADLIQVTGVAHDNDIATIQRMCDRKLTFRLNEQLFVGVRDPDQTLALSARVNLRKRNVLLSATP